MHHSLAVTICRNLTLFSLVVCNKLFNIPTMQKVILNSADFELSRGNVYLFLKFSMFTNEIGLHTSLMAV